MAHRIQIVEDERIVALDLKIALQSLGFEVVANCAPARRPSAARPSCGPT
ncbi:hypothetical protein [Aquitalea magnusonii]|nr:hypothetical protein [Aquitalea magnusonii]